MIPAFALFLEQLEKKASSFRWGYMGDQYYSEHIYFHANSMIKKGTEKNEACTLARQLYVDTYSIRAFLKETDPCISKCPLQTVSSEILPYLSEEEINEIVLAVNAQNWVINKIQKNKWIEAGCKQKDQHIMLMDRPFNKELREAIKEAVGIDDSLYNLIGVG